MFLASFIKNILNSISVFKTIGLKNYHDLKRVERLFYVRLWQIVTYYIKYFFTFRKKNDNKYHFENKFSIPGERAENVLKEMFCKNLNIGPTLKIGRTLFKKPWLFIKSWSWKPNFIVVHTLNLVGKLYIYSTLATFWTPLLK